MTEIPSDATTTKSLLLFGAVSVIEYPTITGKSGKMHGAKIVSMPLIKDIRRSNILFYLCHEGSECRATTPLFY